MRPSQCAEPSALSPVRPARADTPWLEIGVVVAGGARRAVPRISSKPQRGRRIAVARDEIEGRAGSQARLGPLEARGECRSSLRAQSLGRGRRWGHPEKERERESSAADGRAPAMLSARRSSKRASCRPPLGSRRSARPARDLQLLGSAGANGWGSGETPHRRDPRRAGRDRSEDRQSRRCRRRPRGAGSRRERAVSVPPDPNKTEFAKPARKSAPPTSGPTTGLADGRGRSHIFALGRAQRGADAP